MKVSCSGYGLPTNFSGIILLLEVPEVVAIVPDTGAIAGGTAVVIEVVSSSGCTGATLGGVDLEDFTIIDATHVGGTTGAHAGGAVDVLVTNSSGTSAALDNAYTYEDAPTALFSFDFTAMALGPWSAADFLDETGFTFTRSTASTVQTSASTLDSTPDVDDACVGDAGYGRGLVIQQNTKQLGGVVPGADGPRDLTLNWAPGSASHTASYGTGPDGIAPTVSPDVGCSRANATSGQYSNYGNDATSDRRCFSSWQRSKDAASNGSMQTGWLPAGGIPGTGIQVTRAASNTWGRLHLASAGAALQYFAASDGRDYSGSGGDTARARDVLVDFIQLEAGDWPSEAIPFELTRRAGDLLSYPTGTDLIDAGQLRFYAKCIPKSSSTQDTYFNGSGGSGVSDYNYLLSWGSGAELVSIQRSTGKFFAFINGTVVNSDAMTWARGDVVEFYVELGAGLTSKMFYRVNAGAWVDLNADDDVAGDVAPPGAVQIFAYDATPTADSGQFPCWLQEGEFGGVDPTS